MNKLIVLMLFGALISSQAEIVQFDLSPPGTDKAVGLSPSNTVPPAVGSTASGGEILCGIAFDTDSRMLKVAVGYGSAAGFTDLTAPETTSHIHFGGPGTNGNVQIDLHSIHYPATNPASGVFVGILPVGSEDVSNLLAGLFYLDIHTSNFFSGELRGQLIPSSNAPPTVASNAPPTVSCPPSSTVQCGTASEITVQVSDPKGEALNVIWLINGVDFLTNAIPPGPPGAVTNVSYAGIFSYGVNSIGVIAIDSGGGVAACGTTVVVVDTNAPVISRVTADPSVLLPANNQLVEVRVQAIIQDCSSTTWKITSVTGDDSASTNDWLIVSDHRVKLRAARSSKTSTRTYTITVQATDAAGNGSAPATVTVTVPGNLSPGQGHGDDCDDHDGGKNKGKGQDKGKGKGKGH